MSRNILFFVNPISGTANKISLNRLIEEKCISEGASFQIMHTSRDGDYGFLKEKIKKDDLTDIVICGGDGSIAPVITGILGTKIRIGIIPLGSGNGLARTAGIPKDIQKALHTVFHGIVHGVDAFTVNGRLGCQIAGLGFDAYVAAEFARKRKRGLSTYTRLAINHFLKAKPYSFTLNFDGHQFSTSSYMLSISNANQFGNNLKIAPRASLEDGLLDIILVKKTAKIRLPWLLARHLLMGEKTDMAMEKGDRKQFLYFNTSAISIKNSGNAPLHIDGDPIKCPEEVEIKILPTAYRLIQGK